MKPAGHKICIYVLAHLVQPIWINIYALFRTADSARMNEPACVGFFIQYMFASTWVNMFAGLGLLVQKV
jgi:hypothetical protein